MCNAACWSRRGYPGTPERCKSYGTDGSNDRDPIDLPRRGIPDCFKCRSPHMYRKKCSENLSIEEFHLPFGGTLDPGNRWVLLSALMRWKKLEETYSPRLSTPVGAPAKPARLAFGALFIKQRLGLIDEETVKKIRENCLHAVFRWIFWLFEQASLWSIDNGSVFASASPMRI
jgi:hypothetical protein